MPLFVIYDIVSPLYLFKMICTKTLLVQCHNDQFVDLCALQENKAFFIEKFGQKVPQMTPI